MSPPIKQRGVALVMAVLIVALATFLAVDIAFRGYLDQRRALTTLTMDQGYELALGAEAWAADTLAKDFKDNPKFTHLGQKWATPLPPIPIDGGEIQGQLEDMAGRFNLNNLAESDPKKRAAYIKQFKNLLTLIELEPEWADKMADWIDADSNITYPDGNEDEAYGALKPPYLTANLPITRTSELLALKEFGLERYRKLEPYVAALPPGTPINLCTAPGAVIDSFGSALRQYSLDPKFLARQRSGGCFPEPKDLQTALSTSTEEERARAADLKVAATNSQHFRALIVVTLGSYDFTLYSHLQRSISGESTAAVSRSFGTD
jgi:general secretion pathway protein K